MRKIPWKPLDFEGADLASTFIAETIKPWLGTPYMEGQGVPGVKTDCIRSLAGIGRALERKEPIELEHLPPDVALHSRATALAAMRRIAKLFPLWRRIKNPPHFEPGDMLAVGPIEGGPGHAMFVDARPNSLVHASPHGFERTGVGAITKTQKLFCIYRFTERESWAWE